MEEVEVGNKVTYRKSIKFPLFLNLWIEVYNCYTCPPKWEKVCRGMGLRTYKERTLLTGLSTGRDWPAWQGTTVQRVWEGNSESHSRKPNYPGITKHTHPGWSEDATLRSSSKVYFPLRELLKLSIRIFYSIWDTCSFWTLFGRTLSLKQHMLVARGTVGTQGAILDESEQELSLREAEQREVTEKPDLFIREHFWGVSFYLSILISYPKMLSLCSFYKGDTSTMKGHFGTHSTCSEDAFVMLICLSLHWGGEKE